MPMCVYACVLVSLHLHIWVSVSMLVDSMSAWLVSASVCDCRCMPDSVCVFMLAWLFGCVCVFL